jgi:hypothetical protein
MTIIDNTQVGLFPRRILLVPRLVWLVPDIRRTVGGQMPWSQQINRRGTDLYHKHKEIPRGTNGREKLYLSVLLMVTWG